MLASAWIYNIMKTTLVGMTLVQFRRHSYGKMFLFQSALDFMTHCQNVPFSICPWFYDPCDMLVFIFLNAHLHINSMCKFQHKKDEIQSYINLPPETGWVDKNLNVLKQKLYVFPFVNKNLLKHNCQQF